MADNIQIDAPVSLPGERMTVASSARTQVSYAHLAAYAVFAFITFFVFCGVLYMQYDTDKDYKEANMWPPAGSGVP
jgi:hypothetical protein